MLCELESHSCVLINKSAEEMSSLRERINKQFGRSDEQFSWLDEQNRRTVKQFRRLDEQSGQLESDFVHTTNTIPKKDKQFRRCDEQNMWLWELIVRFDKQLLYIGDSHYRVHRRFGPVAFTCISRSAQPPAQQPVITNTKWKLVKLRKLRKLKLTIWTEAVERKMQARLRNPHQKEKAFWRRKKWGLRRLLTHQSTARKTQQLKPQLNQQRQNRSSLAKRPIEVSGIMLSK